jgi:hypothetical protein
MEFNCYIYINMKMTESVLYKCFFKKKNNTYTYYYVKYDYEFGGVIDIEVKITKRKGKFYDNYNNVILTLTDLLEIDNNIKYHGHLNFVYLLKSLYGYKIGKSRQIHNRVRFFYLKLPFDFTVENFILTSNCDKLELDLHDFFKVKNLNGEWFDLNNKDVLFFNQVKITLEKLPLNNDL